jgi:uncharacterized protein
MKSPTKKPDKTPLPIKLRHYVSWFEIPANNFKRAIRFYSKIYGIEMETLEINGYMMGFFPAKNGIGGAVICGEGGVPSDKGPLVYLNGGRNLDMILERIKPAGGRVLLEKTLINKAVGYFALFIDTEGNKLALHSKR